MVAIIIVVSPMAGQEHQQHLEKLITAWNTYVTTHDDDGFSHPQYKGLSVSFDAGEWREDHAQEFPEFTETKRTNSWMLHRRYDCREWYLPASIVKMFLEHEVTQEEVAQFITLLLQKRDTLDQRVILPLPTNSESGGKDSPRAESTA